MYKDRLLASVCCKASVSVRKQVHCIVGNMNFIFCCWFEVGILASLVTSSCTVTWEALVLDDAFIGVFTRIRLPWVPETFRARFPVSVNDHLRDSKSNRRYNWLTRIDQHVKEYFQLCCCCTREKCCAGGFGKFWKSMTSNVLEGFGGVDKSKAMSKQVEYLILFNAIKLLSPIQLLQQV